MLNFDFCNPTHIVFGKDRLNELNNLIPADYKVLILYGGGSVKKFGTLDNVKKALGDRKVFEFGGIEPNPCYETLLNAIEIVKTEKIDFLIALGGGSVIDGTKFVSAACNYKGKTPLEILEKGLSGPADITEAVPFATVLTLPATGSEMNFYSVVTHKESKSKLAFFSPLVFPKFSILDPTLTFTLPKNQVANGIVDTFVHVVEQYITYPVEGRVQDRFSEGILHTLIEIGEKTMNSPEDYDARANLMWCATMALNGLIGAGVPQDWATHMIGHEITALHGLDHGQTLAIVYPAIMSVRKEQKRAKLLQYADRIWGITEGGEDSRINEAIQKTRDFFETLGIKTRLSDYNIEAKDINAIIESLTKHGLTALSETQDVTPDVSRKILEAAL